MTPRNGTFLPMNFIRVAGEQTQAAYSANNPQQVRQIHRGQNGAVCVGDRVLFCFSVWIVTLHLERIRYNVFSPLRCWPF